jgi:hypothetical protein
VTGPRPYRSSGAGSPRERNRVGGFSCGQIGILFFVIVLVALVAGVALGFSLGIFDGLLPPEPSRESPNPTSATLTEIAILEGSPRQTAGAAMPAATITRPPLLPITTPDSTEIASPSPVATTVSTPPATAPVDVCARLDLRFLNATSNIAAWRIGNSSSQPFLLNHIEIKWPASNDAVFNTFLDGVVIWSGEDLVSPSYISEWMGDPADRIITNISRLEFFFGTAAASGGYDLTLRFENGCEVSASN